MKFLFLILSLFFLCRSDGQRNRGRAVPCNTPDNYIGLCVILPNCPSVVNFYAASGGSRQAINYLKGIQRSCGTRSFRGEPVVCCQEAYQGPQRLTTEQPPLPLPQTEPPIEETSHLPEISTTTTTTTAPETTPTNLPPISQTTENLDRLNNPDCRGPDFSEGYCTNLAKCEPLLTRLRANPNDGEFVQFLRLSNQLCKMPTPIVCCPNSRPTNEVTLPPRMSTTQSPLLSNKLFVNTLPTPEDGCGISPVNQKRIVGGEPSQLGAWPWIALVGYINNLGESSFKCGGTLITNRHVVSAAHCVNSNLRFVRLGEHDLSRGNEANHVDINVARVVRHQSYDRKDGHSDISLLYLVTNVQFTVKIRPICLTTAQPLKSKSYISYTPFVAGWGKTLEGGDSADILQQVQLPVLQNSACKSRFETQGRLISEKQFDPAIICAGELTGGKDSCQGDSGGPLMVPENVNRKTHFYLIGVVSYGVGCARAGIPSVYASVQYFIDWIQQKVGETV